MILRRALVGLSALLLTANQAVPAGKTLPECHIHQSKPVSFRNTTAQDILEISIGTGPCYLATLVIVIRDAETGHVLYSYVAPFKQHVIEQSDDPELPQSAATFVSSETAVGTSMTNELPPYLEPEAYQEQHSQSILVSKGEYEALRAKPRPMFSHATYYEGWRIVVIDDTTGMGKAIVEGGV